MQKWEYLEIIVDPSNRRVKTINGKYQEESIEYFSFLKDLGLQGWELVTSTAHDAISNYRFTFKRPIEE